MCLLGFGGVLEGLSLYIWLSVVINHFKSEATPNKEHRDANL